jgi:glycosyltransferase involved in cell wall biosynthesis
MNAILVSHNFPPEVNALATRSYEHARRWSELENSSVEVITDPPHYPEGTIYNGYRNSFARERVDGISVNRVPMFVSSNEGVFRRSISYITFMLSAIWYSRRVEVDPDVVVGSSPQFLAAVAAFVVSRLKGVPFVMEVRDIWPESIVAVGAMNRNFLIRLLERVEIRLYRQADHIVVVTDAFKDDISAKGIPEDKITVLKNGADLSFFDQTLEEERLRTIESKHGLKDKFVVSYIGTIGMAHRADILLEAAVRCQTEDIVFLVMGAGSEREALACRAGELDLHNFCLIPKQPKELVPYYLACSDVSVVHLRDKRLFETVIPSKIFEAMATCTPIALGVRGETRRIIEEADTGLFFEPEDPDALVETVLKMYQNPARHAEMAENGYEHVHKYYDRDKIADKYWKLLEEIAEEGGTE